MTRHEIIRDELNNDPLGRGYSTMSNAEAAADFKIQYRPEAVPLSELENTIRLIGKWTEYRERAEAQDVNGTYFNYAMREFMDLYLASLPSYSVTMRTSEGYISDLADSMVEEGSMGPAAGEALKSYDNNRQTRESELGVGFVTEYDIEYARTL